MPLRRVQIFSQPLVLQVTHHQLLAFRAHRARQILVAFQVLRETLCADNNLVIRVLSKSTKTVTLQATFKKASSWPARHTCVSSRSFSSPFTVHLTPILVILLTRKARLPIQLQATSLGTLPPYLALLRKLESSAQRKAHSAAKLHVEAVLIFSILNSAFSTSPLQASRQALDLLAAHT